MWSVVLQQMQKHIDKALRAWQIDLTNVRGTIPGRNLPTTGNTGAGYTPAVHDINGALHSGTLGVPKGGTGLTSLTSGGIPYATGTTTLATSTGLMYNSGLLSSILSDAGTNAITDVFSATHNTSGTPVTGFGASFLIKLQSSTTPSQEAGRLRFAWSTATHASRAVKGSLTAYYTSTERECIAWEANSSAPLVGFLGATPVIRQVISGNNGGIAGFTALLTGLANLGLITDSTTNSAAIPTGSGTANRLAYWNGTNTLTSNAFLYLDTGNKILLVDNGGSGSAYFQIGDITAVNKLSIIHATAGQTQIQRYAASGQALIDIDPIPADGTSAASFRFFRSTNTSGAASFQIFLGDATGTVNCQFGGNANSYVCSNNSKFGNGINTPSTQEHILLTSAATNAVTNVVTIGHNSTGTAAAGLGAGVIFEIESSTTNAQSAGRMYMEWATATHASRAAKGTLTAFYTSTERTCMIWEANSSEALMGFLGATAVARQAIGAAATDAATTQTLANNIRTALINLGLCKN